MSTRSVREKTLQRLRDLVEEERQLVERALGGERDAFDRLFDRYFTRMMHRYRDLPPQEAQHQVACALEELFKDLQADDDTPVLVRAQEIASRPRPTRGRAAARRRAAQASPSTTPS